MKLFQKDFKKGMVKCLISQPEDLWYLTHIIDPGDVLKAKTYRKIKKSGADERQSSVIKKPMTISIKVEKIDFGSSHDILRVSGTIEEGPEDVPRGSYHTISLELDAQFTLIKQNWLSFQKQKLQESTKDNTQKILLIAFDREEAYIAQMKAYNYEILTHLKGNVQKKADLEKVQGSFYKEIIAAIKEYDSRFGVKHIILASPSFWKEDLLKELKDEELRKKIIPAACSSVDQSSFNEILKRDEVKSALSEDRIAHELRSVEQLLSEIAKQGNCSYGKKEVAVAANAGAIQSLLISSRLIHDMREKGSYDKVDALMRLVDSSGGEIILVDSGNEGGKKLDGIGGIGAILRYKFY